MSSELLAEVTNTADGAPVEVAANRDLERFAIVIQAAAAAGTVTLEVYGPLEEWTVLREDKDLTLNPIFVVNGGPEQYYDKARLTFTGTGGTNRFRAKLRLPRPGAV
jgi:hypothetical protein